MDKITPRRAGILLLGAVFIAFLGWTRPALGQAPHTGSTAADPLPARLEPELWRVSFSDEQELNQLSAQFDVWEVHHADKYIVALIPPRQAEFLVQNGWTLQNISVPSTTTALSSSPLVSGRIPSFPCYRTVEETYADLEQLSVEHPDLASWRDIGDSWEKASPDGTGGYDIQALVLTNRHKSGPKFKLFVMGALHARELTTAETVTRFAERMVDAYGNDPDLSWLLDYGEIHLVPIANPDGRKRAERLLYWRKNTNHTNGCMDDTSFGVDLNRNSSFKWNQCQGGSCSSENACDITYRGPAPASEPESVAYQSYASSIFLDQRGPNDVDIAPSDTTGLFISVHSYGQLVLFPWGWTQTAAPNHEALQTLGNKLGDTLGYYACQAGASGCLYQTDGTAEDWAYGHLGIPAYTFELGTAFFQSCTVFEDSILDKAISALTYAAKVARQPYLTPAGPDVTELAVSNSPVVAGAHVTVTATASDARTTDRDAVPKCGFRALFGGRSCLDHWYTTLHHERRAIILHILLRAICDCPRYGRLGAGQTRALCRSTG